jgi:predicted metallopeptidase
VPKYTRKLNWVKAPDVERKVKRLIKSLNLEWIEQSRIYCFRSQNSKTKAQARIWGLSRIFQIALDQKPAYIIEVIAEKFDKLSSLEQDKVLLHEIAHIPKTFSGSLVPHIRKGKRRFKDKVHGLVTQYLKTKQK